MNLFGAITELQNTVVKLYLKLEHRFKENGLIRDLWSAMAHDVSQQINSLKALPPSFWNQLKKDQDDLLKSITQNAQQQVDEKTEDLSLRSCFEFALGLEEPTILKIYVPIIRSLRKNPANPLDFYIMVKAHLARITRETLSFSGDPIIIQRSNSLLQSFEKEVQEPQVAINPPVKKAMIGRHDREKKPVGKKPSRISEPAHPLAKHASMHHGRAKSLVKKVELPRRRAHR